MLKDYSVPNDISVFVGDPFQCFSQALEQANKLQQLNNTIQFEIVFDSKTNQTTLTIDRISKFADYVQLFGPGDVPGMLTDQDMITIKNISERLPQNGILIEVGSFLGKSTVEWAKNLQSLSKNYKIIAIDSFNTPIDILRQLLTNADFDVPDSATNLEMFNHYTKNYTNITPLVAFFNEEFVFDHPVAAVFEDSDHTQKTLNFALPFWWKQLIPGGILCGHDYTLKDVQVSVDKFALLHNVKVNCGPTGSSIWWIEKC